MAKLTVDMKRVRPLPNAITRRMKAATNTIKIGSLVAVDASGNAELATNANDKPLAGVVIAIDNTRIQTSVVGSVLDVVIFGEVVGLSGTMPKVLFADTGGEINDTAPSTTAQWVKVVGTQTAADTILVNISHAMTQVPAPE